MAVVTRGRTLAKTYGAPAPKWTSVRTSGMLLISYDALDDETAQVLSDPDLVDTIERRRASDRDEDIDIDDFIASLPED